MSIDTRTQAERDYDARRDGSYYTKPINLLADEPVDPPVATLADGTVIYGDLDGTAERGYGPSSVVYITTRDWCFSVDAETISGGDRAQDFAVEGVTLERMQQLRDFLNSGALERMQAAALAWRRGA